MKHKESKGAVRKRVAAWRAKQKEKQVVTNTVTPPLQHRNVTTPVTDDEIANLPPEVKAEIARVSGIMVACGVNNLRERQEAAVRKLRGY